jgi:hypothetical protein
MEGGVHLGPSHAYIPRSDSPGIEPATSYLLGVRFADASEKYGCHRLVAFLPLSSCSRHFHALPFGLSPDNTRLRSQCGRWGSSGAVTCLHTKVGLTGHRPSDLLRASRALYRRVGKEYMSPGGLLVHDNTTAPPRLSPDRSPTPKPVWKVGFILGSHTPAYQDRAHRVSNLRPPTY